MKIASLLRPALFLLATALGLQAQVTVKVDILSRLHLGDFDLKNRTSALWFAPLDAVGQTLPYSGHTNATADYPYLGNRVWSKIRITITGSPEYTSNALYVYANTTHDAPIIKHETYPAQTDLNFSSTDNPQYFRNLPPSMPATKPYVEEFWVGGQIGATTAQAPKLLPGLYTGDFPIIVKVCGKEITGLPRVPVSIRFGPSGSLSLQETRSLHFGSILPNNIDGDVSLDYATGNRTATNGIILTGNTHARGEFTITNINTWQTSATVDLTLPAGPVILTKLYPGTAPTIKATLEARDFKTRIGTVVTTPGAPSTVTIPFTDSTGYKFLVGATLKVKARQEAGEYSGDYPVTLTQL